MCVCRRGGWCVCDGWGSFEKNDYGSLEWLSKTNGYLPWDRRSLRGVIFQEEHIERCELACSCQFGDHQPNISNPSSFCSADHFHTDAPSSVFYVEGVDGQWKRGLKGRNSQPGWTPEASQEVHLFLTTSGDWWLRLTRGWAGWEAQLSDPSDLTVKGTLETLRHNQNAHCWHWMKGEAPTTHRVGAGGFQRISILILSMALWAIRYYLHFWLSVRQS